MLEPFISLVMGNILSKSSALITSDLSVAGFSVKNSVHPVSLSTINDL